MKEFKVKPNLAVGIWLGALTLVWVYDIVMFVLKSLDQQSFIIVSIFLAAMYLYFLGCRPYEYIVDGKTLIFKRRLLPQKEVDLMSCEVICDPVSRMADLVTRPHAIELYTGIWGDSVYADDQSVMNLVSSLIIKLNRTGSHEEYIRRFGANSYKMAI